MVYKLIKVVRKLINSHKKLAKIIAITAIAVVCFLGYKIFAANTKGHHGMEVKVVEVETAELKNIQQTVNLIGTIKPKYSTTLVARAAGVLGPVLPAGQKVLKGELIVKVDNVDIEKNFILSESSEKIAKAQYERANLLYKSGHFSEQAMEEKKSSWINSQKALANAKIELEKIRFYAPFDGIVGVFKVREGTQVREGDFLVSFYDPTARIVEFDIPASVINHINDGQKIKVTGSTYMLNHVQKMLDESTHMCSAYVDITCEQCIIGTTTDVELVVQEKSNVIVIPFEAVFIRGGQDHTYVVKDDKIALVPVRLGIRAKEQVEVISGLQVGENVITRGQGRLFPGAAVKIHKNDNPDKSNGIKK